MFVMFFPCEAQVMQSVVEIPVDTMKIGPAVEFIDTAGDIMPMDIAGFEV